MGGHQSSVVKGVLFPLRFVFLFLDFSHVLYWYYKAFIKVNAHRGDAGAVLLEVNFILLRLHCAKMNNNPSKFGAEDNKSNKLSPL